MHLNNESLRCEAAWHFCERSFLCRVMTRGKEMQSLAELLKSEIGDIRWTAWLGSTKKLPGELGPRPERHALGGYPYLPRALRTVSKIALRIPSTRGLLQTTYSA
jgi:hypothetical protein